MPSQQGNGRSVVRRKSRTIPRVRAELRPAAPTADPYLCKWTDEPIRVDGKLDEKAWLSAPSVTDFRLLGSDRLATTATAAKMLWNEQYFLFAATMEDSDVYSLHVGHDPPFGGDDLIELFVKPSRIRPFYWEFHVSPSGATRDYFYARRNAGPDARWIAYDSGMIAAVSVDGTLNDWEDTDRGWVAELAIPWSAFERGGGRPAPGDRWSFLIGRYDYSVHLDAGLEISTSAALPRTANFHAFEFYRDVLFIR